MVIFCPPPPMHIYSQIDSLKQVWHSIKPALLEVAELPVSDPRAAIAYSRFKANIPVIREKFKSIESSVRDRHDKQRQTLLLITLGILQVNAISLIFSVIVVKKNIDQRENRESELIEAEEKYRKLFESANDAIIATDASGLIVEANPAAARMLGYDKPEDLNGSYGTDFYANSDVRKDLFNELMSKGYVNNYELSYIKKDGTIINVLESAIIYRDDEGNLIRAEGIIRDITKRKMVEIEIKGYAEQYNLIKSTQLFGYWLVDELGKLEDVNDHYCTMSGYTREELIKLSVSDLEVIDTSEDVAERIQKIIETGTDQFESKHRAKDGRIFDVQIQTLYWASQGKFIVFINDISERKQAESELRKLSVAVIQSPVSIMITDAFGIIEYVNPKFLEVTGYRLNEVISKKSSILKSGEQPESYYKTLWTTISSGESWTGEFHNKKKNGELFWESTIISPIVNDSDNITQYIAIKEDITELKQAESEISMALLIAEQANNVKDQFIANISHEIRTPLNSIIGFSDLFQQRYGEMVSEKDHDIFQYITNSSDRLMRTVDSILNISQLSAGAIKIEPRELDLNYIVRSVIGETKPLADEKGLDLTYSPTDQDAMVTVDNFSMHQAILNLIDNAIKYTNDGKIEIKLTQKKDSLRLSIQDTGIGISEEYQKRIFDPYTQESEGFTKKFQGLGLGLALTRRYLELNDVEFEMESEKNVGTTFTLIFPKSDGA